jgi:Carbohydrate family 9 binding domain-like
MIQRNQLLRVCVLALVFGLLMARTVRADEKPVVGLIPRAQHPVVMDGKLDSWQGAWVMPLNATHPDFANRATHIYYLWDEQALYIGVRALDTNPTHISGQEALYDGDALEFYLDTRSGADLGGAEFGPGTLHMFFTAVTGHDLKPRWQVRDLPAFKGLQLKGVEMAAARTPDGYTLEFKLPWSNLPPFTPKAGTPLGIDIEMGSADGQRRVHRTFAYSSPASVGTPATFGRVLLVDKLDPLALKPYSRALLPFDAQTPGNYGRVMGVACVSPTIAEAVVKVEGRLLDAEGKTRKNVENANLLTVSGYWRMWRGEWETFDLPSGTYTLVLTALDAQNHVLVERTRKVLLDP